VTIDRRRDALVRMKEVRRRTGLSRASIYRKMDTGAFPPKVMLSEHAVAWYESDIDRWVSNPMGWGAAT
jgi:prophage regulatory protein